MTTQVYDFISPSSLFHQWSILPTQQPTESPFMMLQTLTILLTTLPLLTSTSPSLLRTLTPVPVAHFTLSRRNGAFSSTEFPNSDNANLTHLSTQLAKAEARFDLTRREVKGNRLVRTAKTDRSGGREDGDGDGGVGMGLMGGVGGEGVW